MWTSVTVGCLDVLATVTTNQDPSNVFAALAMSLQKTVSHAQVGFQFVLLIFRLPVSIYTDRQLVKALKVAGDSCKIRCVIILDANECISGDHNCQQTCLNQDGSYTCACQDGYLMNSDMRTCTDVNECLQSPCSHYCTNEPGSNPSLPNLLLSPLLSTSFFNSPAFPFPNFFSPLSSSTFPINHLSSPSPPLQNLTYLFMFSGSFTCTCDEGFALNNDRVTCADINECENQNGGCAQICLNTAGSRV